jgi:hypothetical protein
MQIRFYLAQLQLESLARVKNKRSLEKHLESIPSSLHEVYAQKMHEINSLPDQEKRMAKRLLHGFC